MRKQLSAVPVQREPFLSFSEMELDKLTGAFFGWDAAGFVAVSHITRLIGFGKSANLPTKFVNRLTGFPCWINHFGGKYFQGTCCSAMPCLSQGNFSRQVYVLLPRLCKAPLLQIRPVHDQVECPTGLRQSQIGKGQCEPCDPGTFAASPGQALCSTCAYGSYAATGGMSSCVACRNGTNDTKLAKFQTTTAFVGGRWVEVQGATSDSYCRCALSKFESGQAHWWV